jgi:microcompartment protein CcmL/EutN
MTMHPALALIEVRSIARGLVVTDAIVKKSAVELLRASPISPGRYITLFWGPVGEVEEASREGITRSGDFLVDHLILPQAHHLLRDTLLGISQQAPVDSLGIVETSTIASALLSLDAALKCADVGILELRLGAGIEGKGYYVLSGPLPDVQAATERAQAALNPQQCVNVEVIPAPAQDFSDFVW